MRGFSRWLQAESRPFTTLFVSLIALPVGVPPLPQPFILVLLILVVLSLLMLTLVYNRGGSS